MRSFGELESRIMQIVWSRPTPVTVHQVLDDLGVDRQVAYTTAVTVIERLREKGWLERHREGRSFRYRATRTEGEYAASLMGQALDEASDRTAALIRFSSQLTQSELTALRNALADTAVAADVGSGGEAGPRDAGALEDHSRSAGDGGRA